MDISRLILIALLVLGQAGGTEVKPSSSEAVARFDHHVHILSPELVRDWKSLGVPFSRPESFYSSASVVLDQNRIEKAVVLSMAYLYGSRNFQRLKSSSEKEHEWVRRENDFIASLVRSAPKRLAGFYSVHPLRPYAMAEIRRCQRVQGLVGLKLHLYNSEVDLTNREHLDRLKEIFAWAEENRVPLLLHLNAIGRTMRAKAMEVLVRELIAKHPKTEIYIAHLGGSGGYSVPAEEVLKVFIKHLGPGGALESRELFFELSAVVLKESSEDVEPPGEERLKQLASDLRSLGLKRILFGSDHPVFNAQDYALTLQQKLNMTGEEVQQILSNEAPVLKRLR